MKYYDLYWSYYCGNLSQIGLWVPSPPRPRLLFLTPVKRRSSLRCLQFRGGGRWDSWFWIESPVDRNVEPSYIGCRLMIVFSNNDFLFTDNRGVVLLQLTAATRRDLIFKNKERRMWCDLHLFTSSQVNLLLEWGHNQSEDTIQPIRRQACSRHVTSVQCRERDQSCWLAQAGELISIILYLHRP